MTAATRHEPMTVLGLMSGTSMDGVDVALIETDGDRHVLAGPVFARAYTADERDLLRQALADAATIRERQQRPGCLGEAEALITRAHAEAVEDFLVNHPDHGGRIDCIGFHGQTVLHRPEQRLTVQIGDADALARRLGLPVVSDFRAADVAAGGQGAPLVPVFHQALVAAARAHGRDLLETVAVLNLGGVANVTLISPGRDPVACDTGPANALIDDFMLERTGIPYDRNGETAARGQPDEACLVRMLAHPFFEVKPPKSLDRNAFSRELVAGLTVEDGAATLTAFTARSVAAIIPLLPVRPEIWILCGGGARNPTMRAMLSDAVKAPVIVSDTLGWSAESLEAQAFGYLAVRSLKGLPISFPTTTGVATPLSGGVLSKPEA
jgi:anhydro-N-acetylmuramic acid kinase